MSSPIMGSRRDKGKGRAINQASERDPLLPSTSSHTGTPRPSHAASRWKHFLYIALIVLSSLTLAALLFLALLAYSFKPSESEIESLSKSAFAYSGPDDIRVVNITDKGIFVDVSLRCGIDADMAMGIANDQRGDNVFARGHGAQWWESLRRWTAEHVLRETDSQSVSVNMKKIDIFPRHFEYQPLLTLSIADPVAIPMIRNADRSTTDWLKPVALTAFARPIASTGQLWQYLQEAWKQGEAQVIVNVPHIEAVLPGGWWSKYARFRKEDLIMDMDFSIPHIPGLPSPGHALNLSSIVTLDGYSFSTTDEALAINARASLPNPLNTAIDVSFGLPFSIALETGEEVAQVVTHPLHAESRINLTMSGQIVTDLSSNREPLSHFLQEYLHGRDNPVIVRGLSHIPSFAQGHNPPAWLLSTLPSLSLELNFPGPSPPPKIIQSVTIEHMRLSEHAGKMQASGTILAEIELPPGLRDVEVNVVEVSPDVLVYNGPAGDEDADPDDPPPGAFGHINPEEFLDSETEPSDVPHRLTVRAPLVDVPLNVLPGRDKVLRDFVSKVVFRGGAMAGVKGTASVRVEIRGISGRMTLDNLPVQGEFWVGKQR